MHLLAIAATAALTLGLAGTARAADAAPQFRDWIADIGSRAERLMPPGTSLVGVVAVEFRRDPRSGRPVGVRVGSAAAPLREAARRTIDKLGVLPSPPAGIRSDTPIALKFLFTRSDTVLMARRTEPAEAVSEGAASALTMQFAALLRGPGASAQRDPC